VIKKILACSFVAVLLGIATMLAPFVLFTDEIDTHVKGFSPPTTEYMQKVPSRTEQAYGIPPVKHPMEAMFVVFLSVFSFVIALGVASYFKRKIV